MTATAFDNIPTLRNEMATRHVPANDSAADNSLRLKQTGLDWRESPQSLLNQSVMKTAGSYPTLIIIGSVYDDAE